MNFVLLTEGITYAELLKPQEYWEGKKPYAVTSPFPSLRRVSVILWENSTCFQFVDLDEGFRTSTIMIRGGYLTAEDLSTAVGFPKLNGKAFVPDIPLPLQRPETLESALLEFGFILGVDFDGVSVPSVSHWTTCE